MIRATNTALAILAVTAIATSAPASASVTYYRVGAGSVINVPIYVCSPGADVSARGDGDTDLDFTITSPTGRVVHSDFDDTDYTRATIDRSRGGCGNYNLRVRNYGDVYNRMTVRID